MYQSNTKDNGKEVASVVVLKILVEKMSDTQIIPSKYL